jgi:hypothetical protein
MFGVLRGIADLGENAMVRLDKNTNTYALMPASKAPQRRVVACEAVLSREIVAEELVACDVGGRIALGDVYLNGFVMTGYIEVVPSPTPGEVVLSFCFSVSGSEMTKTVPWLEDGSAVSFACTLIKVGKVPNRGATNFVTEGSMNWVYSDILMTSAASVGEVLEPHLKDGKLGVVIGFSAVDMVGGRR